MKRIIKRLGTLTIALVMVISMVPPASAVMSASEFEQKTQAITQQQDDIRQQQSALEAEIDALRSKLTSGAKHILAANIVITSPYLIVKDGQNYYWIRSGNYLPMKYSTQYYTLGDITILNVGGTSIRVQEAYQVSEEEQGWHQRMVDARTEIDNLSSQISVLEDQKRDLVAGLVGNIKSFVQDEAHDIIFQIDNPNYYFNYWISLIEDGNYAARPTVINGTTMIPIRPLIKSLNGGVDEGTYWDGETQSVRVVWKNYEIICQLNNSIATVNGQQITMPEPAQAIGGKTMLPLRFIAESLNLPVEWIQDGQAIRIYYDPDNIIENSTTVTTDGRTVFYDDRTGNECVLPSNCKITDTSPTIFPIDLPVIVADGVGGYISFGSTMDLPENAAKVDTVTLNVGSCDVYLSDNGTYGADYYVKVASKELHGADKYQIVAVHAASNYFPADASDPFLQTQAFEETITQSKETLMQAAKEIYKSFKINVATT